MQAVKLRPEEALGGPVRSDWLLLWRVLPRGLPSNGDTRMRWKRYENPQIRQLINII